MSDEKQNAPNWPVVHYDSDCPMCRAFADSLDDGPAEAQNSAPDGSANASAVRFASFRSEPLPEGISAAAIEKEIHVTTAEGTILTGAPAVLYILETKRRWRWLVWFGQLPGTGWIGHLLYSLIAANRFVLFGPHARLFWSKVTVCLAFLIPMPITWKLFYGESVRFYPTTPVSSLLPVLPVAVEHLFFFSLIGLLFAIICTPDPRKLLVAFLSMALGISLFDQSRWMPYYVEYWWMLLALALFPWGRIREGEALVTDRDRVLNLLAVILFGIWFWSGMHKFNARYLLVGYPWMVHPFTGGLSESLKAIVHAGGIVTPFVECGGAILLLFRGTRSAGVYLLVLMHSVILVLFGPFGLNINHSVWSWNVAHIALLFLVFWKRPSLSGRSLLFGSSVFHKFLFALYCVMPILNYWQYWDDFLSHALYSWSTIEAEIEIKDPKVKALLPQEVLANIHTLKGREFVHVLEWSYYNFESPPYHADRVFFSLMRKVCGVTNQSDSLELVIFDHPNWRTGISPKRRFSCSDLSG